MRSIPRSRGPLSLKTGLRLGCVAVALGSLPTSRQIDKEEIDVITLGAIQPPLTGQVRQSRRRGRSATATAATNNGVVVDEGTMTETLDRLLQHTLGSALFASPAGNIEGSLSAEEYELPEIGPWEADSSAAVTGQYTESSLGSHDQEMAREIRSELTTKEDALDGIPMYERQPEEPGSSDADESIARSIFSSYETSLADIPTNSGDVNPVTTPRAHCHSPTHTSSETCSEASAVTPDASEGSRDNPTPDGTPLAIGSKEEPAKASWQELGDLRMVKKTNAEDVEEHDGEVAPIPISENIPVDGIEERRGEERTNDFVAQNSGDELGIGIGIGIPAGAIFYGLEDSTGVCVTRDERRRSLGTEGGDTEVLDIPVDPAVSIEERMLQQGQPDAHGEKSPGRTLLPPTDMLHSEEFRSVTLEPEVAIVSLMSSEGGPSLAPEASDMDESTPSNAAPAPAAAAAEAAAASDGRLSDVKSIGYSLKVGRWDVEDEPSSGSPVIQDSPTAEEARSTSAPSSLPREVPKPDDDDDDDEHSSIKEPQTLRSADRFSGVGKEASVKIKLESEDAENQRSELAEAGKESSEGSLTPLPVASQTGSSPPEAEGEAEGEAGGTQETNQAKTNRIPRDRPFFHYPQAAESELLGDMHTNLPTQLARLSSSLETLERSAEGSFPRAADKTGSSPPLYEAYSEDLTKEKEQIRWLQWTRVGLVEWVNEALERWASAARSSHGGNTVLSALGTCRSKLETWMRYLEESSRHACHRLEFSARHVLNGILGTVRDHMVDPVLAQALE